MILARRALFILPLALLIAAPADAASHHARHAHKGASHGSWDGHWAGAWGGNDPTAINISGGKVVSYEYSGQTHPVSSSRVTAKTVSYGEADIKVTMTRTGANTAHATIHSSHGDGTADMKR